MAVRKIIHIDEEKCTGCGICVPACAEGAIQIIDGKAKLIGENLCDGLGACLGDCPEGALTIEERDADEFDERAVVKHLKNQDETHSEVSSERDVRTTIPHGSTCPGVRLMDFSREAAPTVDNSSGKVDVEKSRLSQWPVQLHLLPPIAPFLQGADLLLVADCVAYSLAGFHTRFLKGKALAIACPKLDSNQEIYLRKLTAMIDEAKINTLTVMIMEVPCCGGLIRLAEKAVKQASRKIPVKLIRVGIRGDILEERWV